MNIALNTKIRIGLDQPIRFAHLWSADFVLMEIENFDRGKIWIQQWEQKKAQNCHQTSVWLKIVPLKIFTISVKKSFQNKSPYRGGWEA